MMLDAFPVSFWIGAQRELGREEIEMGELKRLLLAEDNVKDVELTLAALAENHLANEVVVVRDGEQALAYLRREGPYKDRPIGNPGVVLLDLKMPKVDGLEVLRTIKGDPKLKMIPVVMLTSSREESDLVASYQVGVNAYVVKPVDFNAFVAAVKELGAFWAIVNEPPPGSVKRSSS
jgi:CheY-like chemotaxis protein